MTAALMLLMRMGPAVDNDHGFLCVHKVTIKPALTARCATQAALTTGVDIQPALTASVEISQCPP